eukprot:m.57251 g.57251  ORF g.57251 m.57251 type:complete len:427 (-) comp18856_c1_seq2:64-1344(-)
MPIWNLRRRKQQTQLFVYGCFVLAGLVCWRLFSYREIDLSHGALPCEEYGWITLAKHDDDNGGVPEKPLQQRQRRVFDAFTFNSELDILEVRLTELTTVVDKFILVESPTTFSGRKKPLFYEENKVRFTRFAHQIIHVVVDLDGPLLQMTSAWDRQQLQRTHIVSGLDQAGAAPDDLVVYSDLDEIPRRQVISTLKHCVGYDFPVTLQMASFIYDFNCQEVDWFTHKPHHKWQRGKVVQRKQITAHCGQAMIWPASRRCPEELRDPQLFRLGLFKWAPLTVMNAGWHMSYFLDMQHIVLKIASYAHTERNTEENRKPEFLKCLIAKCKHVNQKDYGFRAPQHCEDTTHQLQSSQQSLQERASAVNLPVLVAQHLMDDDDAVAAVRNQRSRNHHLLHHGGTSPGGHPTWCRSTSAFRYLNASVLSLC